MNANGVLFMFLGGLPLKEDVGQHWGAMLHECPTKTINNIWAVVHPLNRSQATLDSITNSFWGQYLGSRLLICDEAHWVKTSWATRSLVDATLLMMQYSRLSHGAFKKYILLSSACCPIINLTDIVRMFNQNDLSWLQASNQGWPKQVQPVILKENGGLFDVEHLNFFSQWMALDSRHADLFFIGDRTYVVSDDLYHCRESINAVKINPALASHSAYEEMQLALFSFSYDYNDPEVASPCAPTDEHFFGSFLLRKLFQAHGDRSTVSAAQMDLIIRQNLRVITRQNANKMCSILRDYSDVYSILQKVCLPSNQIVIPAITNTRDATFWIGRQIQLNNDGIRNKKWTYCSKNQQPVMLSGIGQKIVSNPVDCEATCTTPGALDQCTAVTGGGTQFSAGYVTVSQTYCDWNAWVPEPENVLRDFRISKVLQLDPNLNWCKFNINAYLQLSSPDLARQYLLDLDIQMEKAGLPSLQSLELNVHDLVMMPNFHPVEYSSWSLRHITNAFVFMTFLSKSFLRKQANGSLQWPHYVFASAYETWKRELRNAWSGQGGLFDGKGNIAPGFWQQTNVSDMPRYAHGITPDTLTACWAAGTPFIRKCKQGCNINVFTDYVIKNTSKIAEGMDITAHASQVHGTIRVPSYARFASIGTSVSQGVLLAALITMLVLWLQAAKLSPMLLKYVYITLGLVILIAVFSTAACLAVTKLRRTDRVFELKESFANDSHDDGLVLGIDSAAAAVNITSLEDHVTLPTNTDFDTLQQAKLEIAKTLQTTTMAKDDPDHINDQLYAPADALANIQATAAPGVI